MLPRVDMIPCLPYTPITEHYVFREVEIACLGVSCHGTMILRLTRLSRLHNELMAVPGRRPSTRIDSSVMRQGLRARKPGTI